MGKMTLVTINCLRAQLSGSNKEVFPLFTGFSTPEELALIAVAPAFTGETTHQEIAADVQSTPVRKWQRPVDTKRTARIAQVFDDLSKIMPNPVLLAQNLVTTKVPRIEPLKAAGGAVTGVNRLSWDVNPDIAIESRPLWILDGQHRIHGLANSARRSDPIPVVLLLTAGSPNSYDSAHFAQIFAQVTAEAEDLKPEHRAWLSYAFGLREFAEQNPDSEQRSSAFEVAARLCSEPPKKGGSPKPFLNGIKFNPTLPAIASGGGFGNPCHDFAKILAEGYYLLEPPTGGHLGPSAIAEELSRFYLALHSAVSDVDASVFFSSNKECSQSIMQDASIHGALAYLHAHGAPGSAGSRDRSWDEVLSELKFDTTDWNFSSWTTDLSGTTNTDSKSAAVRTFNYFFRKMQLDRGINLQEYLFGNGAHFTVTASKQTPTGQKSKNGAKSDSFDALGKRSFHVPAGYRFLEISVPADSPNIGSISLEINTTRLRRKRTLDLEEYKPPFDLLVRSTHYGGNESVHTPLKIIQK